MTRTLLSAVILLIATQVTAKNIAQMNGETYSSARFKDELSTLGHQAEIIKNNISLRQKFLEHLLDNELLAKEAIKNKLHESRDFKIKLAAAKRDILANQFVQSFIDRQTNDSALEAYFNKNKEEFSDKEVRASHILFKESDKEKAKSVLDQALAGADFATLAKKYSIGPSGPKGGDLNFFKKGRMLPAFDLVAFSTPKSKVHPKLVKTRFGLHIIKITDIRGGDDVRFNNKKQQIKRIRSKEIKEELIQKLRKENKVKIDSKALEELKL